MLKHKVSLHFMNVLKYGYPRLPTLNAVYLWYKQKLLLYGTKDTNYGLIFIFCRGEYLLYILLMLIDGVEEKSLSGLYKDNVPSYVS